MEYRPATPADYPGILAVLDRCHGRHLPATERAEQGFVQGTFTPETVARFAAGPGMVVAVEDGQVAGVCMSTLSAPPFGAPAELARYGDRRWGERGWVMYGPVAVDPAFRGRGVLRPMLRALADLLRDYPVAAGFVEAANRKSLQVHKKLGFTFDGGFVHDGRDYHVVTFDPRRAVF